MSFNLTAFNNTNINLTTYITQANVFSNNWFGVMMVVSFFLILFISMKAYGNKAALGATTSITLLFTVLSWSIGFVGDNVMMFMSVLTPLVAVYMYYNKD